MKTIRNLLPLTVFTAMGLASFGLVGCADDTVSGDEQNVRETKKGGEVEVYQSEADGQYRFRLKGANGEKLLASEAYTSRNAVTEGVESLRANGRDPANFVLKKGKAGKYYFTLVSAANGQTLGTGEMYSSKSKAEAGMKTARGYVLGEPKLDDWTKQCGMELYEDAAKEMRFRMVAGNGEIVLKSEGYKSEQGAKDGIDTVIDHGADHESYEISESDDGGWFFNIVAENGEIVASASETYQSESAAEKGMLDVIELVSAQQECFTGELVGSQ